MNGEKIMDWACGYYDQFEHELREGELTIADIEELYHKKKITEFQYRFGMEYLTEG